MCRLPNVAGVYLFSTGGSIKSGKKGLHFEKTLLLLYKNLISEF